MQQAPCAIHVCPCPHELLRLSSLTEALPMYLLAVQASRGDTACMPQQMAWLPESVPCGAGAHLPVLAGHRVWCRLSAQGGGDARGPEACQRAAALAQCPRPWACHASWQRRPAQLRGGSHRHLQAGRLWAEPRAAGWSLAPHHPHLWDGVAHAPRAAARRHHEPRC